MAATITLFVSIAVLLGTWLVGRQLNQARKAKMAVSTNEEISRLADEYRRLADLAVTAQEHTDLKLADITMRLEGLRDQLDSVQRILKDVE